MNKKFGFALAAACMVLALGACNDTDDAADSGCGAVGQMRCVDGIQSVCLANGQWQSQSCPNNQCDAGGQKCASTTPAQVCTPNAQTCSADGASVMICNSAGTSQQSVPCTVGRCDASTGVARCVDNTSTQTECQSGEVKCSDNNAGTINCGYNGKWGTTVLCPSGQTCKEGRCMSSAACTAGATMCSSDLSSTITCGADGQWGAAVPCADGQECSTATSQCAAKSSTGCNLGETKCTDDGTATVTCLRGRWGLPKSCPTGTKCEGGACASTESCVPNSIKCSDDLTGTQMCNGLGKWDAAIPCDNGEKCESNTCVPNDCKAGDMLCSEDKKHAAKCENGQWVKTDCESGEEVCIDGTCKKKVCTAGEDFCDGGTIYKCTDDGMKGDQVKKCDKGCKEDGTCADCKAKERKCDDNGAFYVCVDGNWEKQADCGAGNCKTNNAFTALFGSDNGCKCDEDATRCSDGNGIETCLEEEVADVPFLMWKKTSTCETQCKNGECSCKDGDRRCGSYKKNPTVEICENGKWEVKDNCVGKTEICSEGLSACISKDDKDTQHFICKSSSSNECLQSNLVTCKNGLYEVKESCEYFCVDTWYASPKCKNDCTGTSACTADYKSYYDCKTGIKNECPAGQRCVETKDWANSTRAAKCADEVCVEFSIACDGTKIEVCKDNTIIEVADCADSGSICENGVCVTAK